MLAALVVGAFVGSLFFAFYELSAAQVSASLGELFWDIVLLSAMAALFGLGLCLVYFLPALILLKRVGWAGPASAMSVALLPAVATASFAGTRSFGIVLALYCVPAGLTFALLAYRAPRA